MALAECPTITNEKLEEYLSIWHNLIDQGYRKILDITFDGEYTWGIGAHYTLTYGEERRKLTSEQACQVADWFENVRKEAGSEWNS